MGVWGIIADHYPPPPPVCCVIDASAHAKPPPQYLQVYSGPGVMPEQSLFLGIQKSDLAHSQGPQSRYPLIGGADLAAVVGKCLKNSDSKRNFVLVELLSAVEQMQYNMVYASGKVWVPLEGEGAHGAGEGWVGIPQVTSRRVAMRMHTGQLHRRGIVIPREPS